MTEHEQSALVDEVIAMLAALTALLQTAHAMLKAEAAKAATAPH